MSSDQPNPGSEAARKHGCLCPVLDNARGLGAQGTRGPDAVFWMRGDCPMHGVVMSDEQ